MGSHRGMDFINPTVVKLAAAQLQIPFASSKKTTTLNYILVCTNILSAIQIQMKQY